MNASRDDDAHHGSDVPSSGLISGHQVKDRNSQQQQLNQRHGFNYHQHHRFSEESFQMNQRLSSNINTRNLLWYVSIDN